mgnify:CR=1 FL=1
MNKKQFKDNLDNLVDSLVKLSPQVIDNIIKRACQLPTDYSKLSSLDKKLGNYYSSLLYFITELGSKSKYTGNDINLKSDEILQSCGKAVDKLKFPLDLMFNLAEIVPSIDRYKNLFTSIINNSDTLYAGELTDREEKVLRMRFGLLDGRSRTLEEVGREFGVTRERIRQIEAKALRKLRHPSRSKKLKDFMSGK